MSLADKLRAARVKRPSEFIAEPSLLLQPNIPKPMHGLAPRVVLGQKWWNETRRAAYLSTGYRCKACAVCLEGSKRWLEGHETYAIDYRKGRTTYVETVPLCHYCHCYIHDGRLEYLLEAGKIAPQVFVSIIQHGDRVLAEAGLLRPSKEERDKLLPKDVAPWNEWRLVVFGKLYKPLYKSLAEWEAHYK